jgi:hypothetical protein
VILFSNGSVWTVAQDAAFDTDEKVRADARDLASQLVLPGPFEERASHKSSFVQRGLHAMR